MADITIKMKIGEVKKFKHVGTITFEGGFAIIKDEWGTRTAIPAADIEEIIEQPSHW